MAYHKTSTACPDRDPLIVASGAGGDANVPRDAVAVGGFNKDDPVWERRAQEFVTRDGHRVGAVGEVEGGTLHGVEHGQWDTAKRGVDMDEPVAHCQVVEQGGDAWSAQSGATLKEVMARIGHSSTRAAMIYQHATRERDRAIAAALDALIDEARGESGVGAAGGGGAA